MRDFPGGPVVKNPPSYAGDVDSIPDQGNKITHAVGKLSLCATNSWACVSQLEGSPWVAMKDPVCCNEDPVQPKLNK